MKAQLPPTKPVMKVFAPMRPRRIEGVGPTRSLLDIPVHYDAAAGAVANAADARAVTIGAQIYMSPITYQPSTQEGRELIAHEQVHVAQNQLGQAADESSVCAAEAEAKRLSPTIARDGWQGVSVTQRGAPVLRDPLPERDLSEDRKSIKQTLESRNPWLFLLSNREAIVAEFVERIALERRVISTTTKLKSLPDPSKTILSEEIDRRNRARAPVERKFQREAGERDKHQTRIKFDLSDLISVDLRVQSATSTGAAEVIHELKNHQGWVHLDHNEFDSFRYGLDLQIDGAWLPIDNTGIHLWTFFRDPSMTYTMARFQEIYLSAASKQMGELLAEFVDSAPEVAEQQLDSYVGEQDAAQLPPARQLSADEQMVDDYLVANKEYAATVRQKTQQAMAPLIFIAGLFEIDGPVDLLLTVVPVEKIGAKVFKLGKEAMQARKARKLELALMKEFEGHLDEEAKAFLKLARGLEKSEVTALKTINASLKSDALVVALMKRSVAGTANLEWIAKKLQNKDFDANFVRAFTQAESGPSWKAFEDVIEKRKGVSEGARESLASKLTGLLGEEAAVKAFKTEAFKRLALGTRADAKIAKVVREVSYGGKKSLDIVGLSDKAELVFGEVKHWSTSTWMDHSSDVLAQLDRHNAGIDEIAGKLNRRASDVKSKILFVSRDGFEGLALDVQDKLATKIRGKGWKLNFIADSKIEDFTQLIDRVR